MKLPTALSPASIISIGAVVWSVALPFFPAPLFEAIRNPLATVVLLVAVILALPYGPIPGVIVLFAVFLTFVERNRLHIKNALLSKATGEEPKYETQMAPALPMSPQEIHPSANTPETESIDYMPGEDSGSNAFEPVDQTIDEKNVIPTISSTPEVAEKFFLQQGLGATELRG